MQITKINGDRLSPWKMPLLTLTSHKSDPLELKRSFHFFMFFSKKLYVIRKTKHVKAIYNPPMWDKVIGL